MIQQHRVPLASWRRFFLVFFVILAVEGSTKVSVDAITTTTKIHAARSAGGGQDSGDTECIVSSFRNYTSTTTGDLSSGEESEFVSVVTQRKNIPTRRLKATYQWYLKSCTDRPFVAKGLTSATIAALGDTIAQHIERASDTGFSSKRVATFFFCNLLFTGPFIHMWYTFLNIVGNKMDERFQGVSKLKKTFTQVFLDQTIGTFVFFPLYIYVYEVFDATIRWHRLPMWSKATEKCQKHLWGIILTQYRVFPISNMINFGLIPYELRVLFTSTVSLFWNIYLCSVVG